MKTIKIIALILAAGFAGLLGYANVRHLSVTEKLKRVHLVSFNLKGEINSTEALLLEKKVSTTPGITSCSVNKDGNVASVIFYPDQVTEQILASLLSNEGKLTVSGRKLSSSEGCPVHQLSYSFHEFLTLLDVRN